jgi:branched-chain amino acid aminotransferase
MTGVIPAPGGSRLNSEEAMAQRTVFFSGRFVTEAEARVSIFDSALMYGDMAFEMTRTYRREPFKLRDHLNRLYASLKLLEIDCGLSPAEMERITLETLKRNLPTEAADMDWQIMHDVSRGPLDLYRRAFAEPLRPTISINCWPLITHMGRFAATYENGVLEIRVPKQSIAQPYRIEVK